MHIYVCVYIYIYMHIHTAEVTDHEYTFIHTHTHTHTHTHIYIYECCLVAKLCPTLLQPHGLQPTRLPCPWDFPGRNTGVGCHFLLQGIFPTQGSILCLLHCRWILYCWATREALYYIHTHIYHTHTMKYYSAINPTGMDLESTVLSEINQTNTVWLHLYVGSK